MNAWTLVGFGTNAAVIIMAVAWAIARRVKNASYLEVAWSYGFALVVRIYALIGPGEPLRKWLITGMVTIWSLRLGTSLFLKSYGIIQRRGTAMRPCASSFPNVLGSCSSDFLSIRPLCSDCSRLPSQSAARMRLRE